MSLLPGAGMAGMPAMPAMPRGRVQRGVPAPFHRPRIAIGEATAVTRRHWANVAVLDLKEGDIVPGVGRLCAVDQHMSAPAHGSGRPAQAVVAEIEWTVTIRGGAGNVRTYPGNDQVYAFTENPR